MKKVLFILLCSFVSFAFTNERVEPVSVERTETISPEDTKTYPSYNSLIIENTTTAGICEQGVKKNFTITVHCEWDGEPSYVWTGNICVEHIMALVNQFAESC